MIDNGLSIKYKTLLASKGVNTPKRKACFFARLKVECGLVPKSEDLKNYSAETLHKVFFKYFPTLALAEKYVGKQELIANYVYANRMGNGPVASGDGFKFRGGGFMQTTGRRMYELLSKVIGIDLIAHPEKINEEATAMVIALWHWEQIKGNALADKWDLDAINDRINIGHDTEKVGDANGYKEMVKFAEQMLKQYEADEKKK